MTTALLGADESIYVFIRVGGNPEKKPPVQSGQASTIQSQNNTFTGL